MDGSIEIRVRYAETDQMGRAHHSHYLVWCELARTTLMREHDLSYTELERQGLRLPVSRAEVEYRRPVGYDEQVRVEIRIEAIRSREVAFSYRLTRVEDGALVATARTSLVSADVRGRPVRLPDEVRARLEALAARGEAGTRSGIS